MPADQSSVGSAARPRSDDDNPSDSAIVAAIITLAHTLGLEAVAEGVETPAQLDELRSLGCDKAQGFFMARPSSGDDIGELLEQRPAW